MTKTIGITFALAILLVCCKGHTQEAGLSWDIVEQHRTYHAPAAPRKTAADICFDIVEHCAAPEAAPPDPRWAEAAALIDFRIVEDTPRPSPASQPQTTRPIVYGYSAPWCVNCPHAKADAVGLPFIVDWSKPPPSWVKSLPTFAWQDQRGKWHYLNGYPGRLELLRLWDKSRSNSEKSKPIQAR